MLFRSESKIPEFAGVVNLFSRSSVRSGLLPELNFEDVRGLVQACANALRSNRDRSVARVISIRRKV